MKANKTTLEFTLLTFCIAYFSAGILIIASHFGYTVYNWVSSFAQLLADLPFTIYILSPAIASFLVLKKNRKIESLAEWLKNVFYVKNSWQLYFYVFAMLALYFFIHYLLAQDKEFAQPFYTFFLSIPGNLFIGGLEEAGWTYVLQADLAQKCGYIRSSFFTAMIWLLWHIPLFFIAGTNHSTGAINFVTFAIQLMAFRFVYGAIYQLAEKGGVFLCILFHTLFNALSPIFTSVVMTWQGTILANGALLLISLISVFLQNKKGPADFTSTGGSKK